MDNKVNPAGISVAAIRERWAKVKTVGPFQVVGVKPSDRFIKNIVEHGAVLVTNATSVLALTGVADKESQNFQQSVDEAIALAHAKDDVEILLHLLDEVSKCSFQETWPFPADSGGEGLGKVEAREWFEALPNMLMVSATELLSITDDTKGVAHVGIMVRSSHIVGTGEILFAIHELIGRLGSAPNAASDE